MKNTRPDKYPHSATLFRFCKQALEMRYAGNVKVIDQDVGSILGYDPADCSHWKKGKKNIKTLNILKSIAEHLSIDERLLIGITTGSIHLNEALFEYQGYGDFSFSDSNLENLKKDYFRSPDKWRQNNGDLKPFEELFKIDRKSLSKLANTLLEKVSPIKAPVSISEIYRLFNCVKFKVLEEENSNYKLDYSQSFESKEVMTFNMPSNQPSFMRFIAIKELYKHLRSTKDPILVCYPSSPKEVIDIESNIFAGLILIPDEALKNCMPEVDVSQDLIKQLAERFDVSLALMNKRLSYFITN